MPLLFIKLNVIAGLLRMCFWGSVPSSVLPNPADPWVGTKLSKAINCSGHSRCQTHTHTMPFYLWKYTQIYSACTRSSVQIPPLSHRRQEGCGLKDMVASSECAVVLQKTSCFHAGWTLYCILEDTAQPCPKSNIHFSKGDHGYFFTFYP